MNGREYLKKLMEEHQDNPNSLSSKTRVPQPTIFRFLSGEAKEPRRSTLEPIARHYGVSVEAFFETAGKATVVRKIDRPDNKRLAWPFASIPEDEVHALPSGDLKALEGAMALAIAQLKLKVQIAGPTVYEADTPVAPLRTAEPRAQRPDIARVDYEDREDDPFASPPAPLKPWEPGGPSYHEELRRPLRISTASYVGHIADAGYSANDHEFTNVPELDVRLAAGRLGIENYTESQIGEMHLRTSFLKSFGLPIERMRIVYGDGDSMEPVIRNRAPMLFIEEPVTDRSQIDPHTIYAINQGGKMLVKCIAKSRLSGWVMRSLNPTYPDAPLSDDDGREVRIIGRILWSPYDLRHGVDERLLRR